jgi:hypothetical protein
VTATPLPDILAEARRILDHGGGTPLRLLGGAAVALAVPGGVLLPRAYKDIDFVTAAGRGPETVRAFDELGYVGDQRFNGLNGHRRLLFFDRANERQVDVFVAKFEMCHVIPLMKRLTLNDLTIPLADLLLTKLQIFSLNEKDQRDIVNLVHAHPLGQTDDEGMINAGYVAQLLGGDWGLWRTVTLNIERVRGAIAGYGLAPEQAQLVQSRLDELRSRVDAEPKSAKWKLRARVGERVKWYEEPEEVG